MVQVTELDSSLRAEQLTLKRSLLFAKNVPLAHFLNALSLLRFKSLGFIYTKKKPVNISLLVSNGAGNRT